MENSEDDKADVKFVVYTEEERLEEDPVAETEDVYQCSSCNFNFPNVEEHLKKYHSEPSDDIIEVINEDVNEAETEGEGDDALAFVVKNDQGLYECSECYRSFKGLKRFVNHVKLHDNYPLDSIEALQECAMKREQSKDEDCMKISKDTDGEQLFSCKICNVKFGTRKQLLLHVSIHKNVETAKRKWSEVDGKTFDCQQCNKSFPNVFEYDLHVQAHVENKKSEPAKAVFVKPSSTSVKGVHSCQFCGKEFKRPHEKVKHERVHTGEKPYSCDICGKKFRVTYCLSLHKRNVHSEDRPYICTFQGCNKRFKAQSVYNHHLNTHSEDKKYKCPFCVKCFKTSVQLIGHKKTHTKPFACSICKRTFSALYAVKNHMATHQVENSNLKLTCNVCGAQYGRAFALKDHLKTAHPEVEQEKDDIEEVGESYIIETEIDMNNDDGELYSVVMDEEGEQILGE